MHSPPSDANPHFHFHLVVLDGLFTEQSDGTVRFDETTHLHADDAHALQRAPSSAACSIRPPQGPSLRPTRKTTFEKKRLNFLSFMWGFAALLAVVAELCSRELGSIGGSSPSQLGPIMFGALLVVPLVPLTGSLIGSLALLARRDFSRGQTATEHGHGGVAG